jgi:hypothetical protein
MVNDLDNLFFLTGICDHITLSLRRGEGYREPFKEVIWRLYDRINSPEGNLEGKSDPQIAAEICQK